MEKIKLIILPTLALFAISFIFYTLTCNPEASLDIALARGAVRGVLNCIVGFIVVYIFDIRKKENPSKASIWGSYAIVTVVVIGMDALQMALGW